MSETSPSRMHKKCYRWFQRMLVISNCHKSSSSEHLVADERQVWRARNILYSCPCVSQKQELKKSNSSVFNEYINEYDNVHLFGLTNYVTLETKHDQFGLLVQWTDDGICHLHVLWNLVNQLLIWRFARL